MWVVCANFKLNACLKSWNWFKKYKAKYPTAIQKNVLDILCCAGMLCYVMLDEDRKDRAKYSPTIQKDIPDILDCEHLITQPLSSELHPELWKVCHYFTPED